MFSNAVLIISIIIISVLSIELIKDDNCDATDNC